MEMGISSHTVGLDLCANITLTLFRLKDISVDIDEYNDLIPVLEEACSSERKLNILETYGYLDQFLHLYIPPVLLALGTFGNCLTFTIMAQYMFTVSTYSYFAVLAVMDFLVLYIGLLGTWVGNFTIQIQSTSNWMCKAVSFLAYVSSDTSVWLIIAVTVERYIAVKCPLRAPRMCKVNRARLVIVALIILMCTVHSHFIWTVELQNYGFDKHNSSECGSSKGHEILVDVVWPWVDAVIYSFVPFVIISFLNALIIHQVVFARKRRSQMQLLEISSKAKNRINKVQLKKSNESNKKLTFMLLAVSLTFLITTLPMNIIMIVKAVSLSRNKDLYENAIWNAQIKLAFTVAELLMYANHSINFFLYCATGRKFRGQVKILVCLCCKGNFLQFFQRRYNASSASPSVSYKSSRLNSTNHVFSLTEGSDRTNLSNVSRSLLVQTGKRAVLIHTDNRFNFDELSSKRRVICPMASCCPMKL